MIKKIAIGIVSVVVLIVVGSFLNALRKEFKTRYTVICPVVKLVAENVTDFKVLEGGIGVTFNANGQKYIINAHGCMAYEL